MGGVPWIEISAVVATFAAIIGVFIGTQRYNTDKRSRIYERLDEYKKGITMEMKKDYSRKDICILKHDQVDKRLEKIEEQTALLPDIAAQLKMLVNGHGSN